ncbi:hypothetical protein Vretimale_15270 [Volvox reticuliferus]|uniref:Uncharacterized protein n=1 Tax=Volvox reticuliferus TaxID=1737510 RepID=A0A8J4FGT0_9CHLO|nr:hypothetical protein Vretifemale_5432 [Volvox reticuliferus]GIM11813.1 hypothetical protein Vretimale_15270 [Volvox reticuliferus]
MVASGSVYKLKFKLPCYFQSLHNKISIRAKSHAFLNLRTVLTFLALNALFGLATATVRETEAKLVDLQPIAVHPFCRCNEDVCQPYARGIVDITAVLRTAAGLPEGACVFNPAISRLAGNIFCVFARVYIARSTERRCIPGRLDRPPFMDAWNGTLANLLAVVRLRGGRQSGNVTASVLGHRYLSEFNYEDGRLFHDQRGRLFLYLSLPFGKYGGARASVNTVFRVLITCRRTPGPNKCDPQLGPPRLLRYDRSIAWDKNWVPWNGTNMMSYSHYGPFGPHSVFNWSTYRDPVPHARFYSKCNQTFFRTFSTTFGRLMHLSGGTPAILEPSGTTYLAVGHMRVHPGCLHPESIPGLEKVLGTGIRVNCGHMLTLDSHVKGSIPFRTFMYRAPDGNMTKHYHVDYGLFLYRFTAAPPYTITHISHGFLPPSEGHFGIVFPSGLERFGPFGEDYVVAYGDADQVARLMLLTQFDVEKLLVPLLLMEKRISGLSVCTLPFADNVPAPLRLLQGR